MNKDIMITFDDCCETVATKALPIFNKYSIVGTFFTCGAYVSTKELKCSCKVKCDKSITVNQLYDLIKSGWEIGSHTWSHIKVDVAIKDKLVNEINKNHVWLKTLGIEPVGISYPWGRYSDDAINYIKKYYKYARATCATKPSLKDETYRIRSYVLSASNKLSDVIKIVEYRSSQDLNTVFFGHRIGDTPDGYSWNESDLDYFIQYFLDKGYKFKTMKDVYGT